MPALFSGGGGDTFTPLAQLGAGEDGTVVLARRGDRLVETHQLVFGPGSPKWEALELHVRAIGAVEHPAVRVVLALESEPPQVVLEGDSFPQLAELLEQPGVDIVRAMRMLVELARALATAHHVGVVHGNVHPWTVWIGTSDRPRFELTQLRTRTIHHEWATRCRAPELELGAADSTADVFAMGALIQIAMTSGGRTVDDSLLAIANDATESDPDIRPTMIELVQRLHAALAAIQGRPTQQSMTDALRTVMLDPLALEGPPRPAIGVKIGRYELVRALGIGAMGEVWEAKDTATEEPVAIKLLKPEIAADAELLRRFRKEARVLSRVGSPYIANILDLNEDRGLHYLVLELVKGGSVGSALKRVGNMTEKLALGIVGDACRALAEPHRLGIVHRDLKPDNMMFVRQGIELETAPLGQLVKLGDFGIARVQEAVPDGATREGSVLGTPEFMAPEQCQGTQVTAATDVYALGCCLFTLIAGRTPFVVVDDNQMGVILQHLREAPPRLDAVMPEATPAVANLVEKCLAKDPKARPADAAELFSEIERMCEGSSVLMAAHPSPPIVRESLVQTYALQWDLAATPEQLLPFL